MNDFKEKFFPYIIAVAGISLLTFVMFNLQPQINPITVSLFLLLFILFTATFFGSKPAILASFLAMFSLNFFFLPPVGKLTVYDPENWVALIAFLTVSLTAGQLSAKAKKRAEEAERLYGELQIAFKTATEAEALKQSEKLKSALLDAVTHDLRTPLTSIKAAVTTLLESEGGHRTIELDSVGRTEFLEIVNEETDRLNRFIEGMVELARLEAGSPNRATSLATLDEILPIALERAASLPGDHVVQVSRSAELPFIKADARAVAEVIYNLLENAAKYSPAGSTISISAGHDEPNVVISINDEGPGIPCDMRERVFEKFVRLGEVKPGGMGLGLA